MLSLLIAATLAVDVPPSLVDYLDRSAPIADGFAVGKGATAPARGRVVRAADGRVELAHVYFEHADRKVARTVVSGLTALAVTEGQTVEQGAPLGSGKATLTIDGQAPAAFVAARAPAFNPLGADRAFVVDVDARRLVALEKGLPVATWDVAIGQAEGPKEMRGDLKTPRGMFFVTDRYHGKFSGDWADFYGEYWVKLNYPGPVDAARGLDAGLVTPAQAAAIREAWPKKALTPQNTRLGGGIGFHAWASEWSADAGTLMSFGCVVLHPAQVAEFYARVQVGDLVVLR